MSLLSPLLRRLLHLLLVALLVTSFTFFLSSLIPSDFYTRLEADPRILPETLESLRERFGFNDPIFVQYARWLWRLLRLDLGYSLFYGEAVHSVLLGALLNTLWLGFPALLFGVLFGITIGGLHAIYQHTLPGHLLSLLSIVLLSLPSLILGLGALLLAAHTQWFPVGGMESAGLEVTSLAGTVVDRVRHLVLPTLCLTIPIFVYVERLQFATARESLGENYLKAARSRGLSRGHIFVHYVTRPSLNPVLSTLGPLFGAVLSGSLVLEYVFSWPGLGMITYEALVQRDIFLILGCVAGGSILLVAGNLIADLLLLMMDPRTRLHGSSAS